MSTRSFVGLIKDGKVGYAFHGMDSYLEDLGIELFTSVKSEYDLKKRFRAYGINPDGLDTKDEKSFFNATFENPSIEFCYAFNAADNKWYVSSCHGKKDKVYEMKALLGSKEELKPFSNMYVEDFKEPFINMCLEASEEKEDKIKAEYFAKITFDGKSRYVYIQEGSGDNLLSSDRKNGYVDYIDFEVYETRKALEERDDEYEGGMVLLEEPYGEGKSDSTDKIIKLVLEEYGKPDAIYKLFDMEF